MSARPIGSIHRGLGEWLVQRFTGLYLAGFVLFTSLYFIIMPAADYAVWQERMACNWVRISLVLFFLSAFAHAWVGMRSVYLDYLKSLGVRFVVSCLTALVLLAMSVWVGEILLWGLPS